MFDPQSRYYDLETATLTVRGRDGESREVRYIRRRPIPPPPTEDEVVAEHRVVDGDRIDTIAARYLDDPLQYWRICDANRPLHPGDLTDEVGETITVALPRL